MVGDAVFKQVEHRIRIGKRLLRCLELQKRDDVVGRIRAHVGHDQGFLQAIPKLVVEFRTPVQQQVHFLPKCVA